VHHDEPPEGRVLRGAKPYFHANKKLRALLFVVLCKKLGIAEPVALMGALTSGDIL
jgi:hypothetical protein